eukprot:4010118-Amphidinium_carterae.1
MVASWELYITEDVVDYAFRFNGAVSRLALGSDDLNGQSPNNNTHQMPQQQHLCTQNTTSPSSTQAAPM